MTILDARTSDPMTGGASFSFANRIERLAWAICWALLARWTPARLSPWRILLLRLFGAQLGRNAAIAASATVWLPRHLTMGCDSSIGPGVDCYNMAPITIGERTIVSQRAFLCAGTHDVSDPRFQLVARPIAIGDDVWIAAEAFVGPGVVVGAGAVLAARACAFSALRSQTIYRGNPATELRRRETRDDAERMPTSRGTGW